MLNQVAASVERSQCPDADELVALARGELRDGELRRIEAHLDVCSLCTELAAASAKLVDEPEPPLATVIAGGPVSDPGPRLLPGTAVGRYIVLAHVGSGGMGEVCAAYDRELDRKVALKILKPRGDLRPDQWKLLQTRLMREARAMAKLNHPNAVPVHDIGWYASQMFIAMEYIDGDTLLGWLRQRPRTWQAVRDVFVKAGSALAAAHAAGFVHRDFKPANVLVDRNDRVYVADFGLVTALHPSGIGSRSPVALAFDLDDATETQAGLVLGTPAYMAPEQLAGGAVDGRADQYSFCASMFEALHGYRPNARARHDGASGVPSWLDRVLQRGLAPDPSRRYPSMDALLHALGADARGRRRRRRVLAAVAVALLAPAVWVGWQWRWQPPPNGAELIAIAVLAGQARSEAAAGRYIYPPASDPDQPTAYTRLIELEQHSSTGRERAANLRSEFSDELVAIGDELWEQPGGEMFAADFYAGALVFDPSSRRARERAGLTLGEVAGLRRQAATLEYTRGELNAADSLQALARPRGASRAALVRRAVRPTVVEAKLRETEAEPPPDRSGPPQPKVAVSAVDDEPRRPDVDAAVELRAGDEALERADLEAAERHYQRALRGSRTQHRAFAGLGEVAFERGAYAKAVEQFGKAVELAPKRAAYRVQLGDALLKVSRHAAAREQYERARTLGSEIGRKRLSMLDAQVEP